LTAAARKTISESMNCRLIALSLGLLGTALLVSPARAQRHGGGFASASRTAAAISHQGAIGSRFGRMHRVRRVHPRSGYGPNYYPYYDYYSDYDSVDGIVEPPSSRTTEQIAAPEVLTSAPKPAESLVMELRGDRWVRLTSYGPMEVGEKFGGQRSPSEAKAAYTQTHTPSELPPAMLIFRDGHREEAAKYTIVGRTITIKTDYWSSGSWTRKVSIDDLDLATTMKVNQERGAKFSLPSRPSEVIVRP
jgi:hypothetical protein